MKINFKKELGKDQLLVNGLFAGEKHLSVKLNEELKEATKRKTFDTEKFGLQYFTVLDGQKMLVLSLGKKYEFTLNHLRRALGKAVKYTKTLKLDTFATDLTEKCRSISSFSSEGIGRCTAEGLILGNYAFNKYLTGERKDELKPLAEVTVQWSGDSNIEKGWKTGAVIAESTNYVRDLVNEPASLVTPTFLEFEAKKLKNVKVKVINKEEMKKLGMNALLGVSLGSAQPPKLIIIEYNGGKKEEKPVAIVGKGITFDAGGLNLKPTKYIEDMKIDMSGAGAVLGTIKVAVELGIKKNIIGVIPSCENLVGCSAQKPGDIVKAYNGKTIEIGNTDAEGRLILADALAYAEDIYKPEVMVDLATLTGAVVVALGYEAAGLITKDDSLARELEEAGKKSYDLLWRLPFFEEYQDAMNGKISDLNNISTKGKGYEAGSITGAVFLSNFVEKARWAHLDIAGRACVPLETDYQPMYATGAGVRLLCYWLMGL
ncbi:leucyl aminopeptidase [Candidatus Woesearchaeota archaeon]|nr:leucyl aminopeptidase [Candidatus Woesearchaeota archaeon]